MKGGVWEEETQEEVRRQPRASSSCPDEGLGSPPGAPAGSGGEVTHRVRSEGGKAAAPWALGSFTPQVC